MILIGVTISELNISKLKDGNHIILISAISPLAMLATVWSLQVVPVHASVVESLILKLIGMIRLLL